MASFLVIGLGRFGRVVATELYKMKHDVLALDEREEYVSGIAECVTNVVIGDARDEAVLRSLGVENFDCAVVAIGSAVEDNVLITIMLKEMGVKKVVCRAQNEWHAKILSQIGADRVIRPEYDMGKRVAQSLAQKNIIDHLEISPEHSIIEINTPSHWADKCIKNINVRRRYGISVVAITRAETGEVKFLPNADTVLKSGDVLTVIGFTKDLDKISALK